MAEWWDALSTLQHIFLYAAIPFTLILIIQAVMTLIGLGGGEADADADIDADADLDMDSDFDTDVDFDTEIDTDMGEPSLSLTGFRFFTVRGIVAFFCIFGWTGYTLGGQSLPVGLTLLISAAAGFVAMLVIGLMFFAVKRLQSSGNLRFSNAVGHVAEVYIPIPASRIGKGKVMVEIQERLVEAEAVTDEKAKLKTGESVRVIGSVGNTLIVKR